MRVYNKVKTLLEEDIKYRNSDKEIFIRIMEDSGAIVNGVFNRDVFMKMPSFESYRRCRQKLQETHPELRGSKYIQDKRSEIALDKGTYIYREEVQTAMF